MTNANFFLVNLRWSVCPPSFSAVSVAWESGATSTSPSAGWDEGFVAALSTCEDSTPISTVAHLGKVQVHQCGRELCVVWKKENVKKCMCGKVQDLWTTYCRTIDLLYIWRMECLCWLANQGWRLRAAGDCKWAWIYQKELYNFIAKKFCMHQCDLLNLHAIAPSFDCIYEGWNVSVDWRVKGMPSPKASPLAREEISASLSDFIVVRTYVTIVWYRQPSLISIFTFFSLFFSVNYEARVKTLSCLPY